MWNLFITILKKDVCFTRNNPKIIKLDLNNVQIKESTSIINFPVQRAGKKNSDHHHQVVVETLVYHFAANGETMLFSRRITETIVLK